MKYEVQLSKTFKRFRIIEVEAADEAQAKLLALRQARKDDEAGLTEEWVDSLPGRRRVEWVQEG
jgi:hypothetical protein